ncbi:MAG: alanine--tRNA ligase [Bacteroidales bacterium]|nr:alanine--tRNA ligase [Bacteroidales bacterium]
MTSTEIRASFTQFFASKGHKIVPSAPMVIKDDPTLMFTNAGMNQFKDIILGNAVPSSRRVANSQKCLRVSGKHNDLEEVGHDTYHHTMFEMLGNWSFGDYFKEEAISWAWEYLVDVLKIDPNRLYATVFEGYAPEGLERDNEAAAIWGRFLPIDRIINGNKKDNFWEMGDTGPCGPCSEIHIDLRPDEERAKVDGLTLVNESHPLVIEIWNNVFMQYNRKADGSLELLPARHVDTGMGFERLCMAIQGKFSNYDTDVFQPIIQTIANHCQVTYGEEPKADIAMRVIADHIRTIAFSITDGQLPSNAKAGYVIRRILRRAVRYGYTFLGRRHAFLYQLIPSLIRSMGAAYPELSAQQPLIEKVIKEEEESFLRTLETGIRLLDKLMADARAAKTDTLSGNDVFTLYDTYGFPVDLTELILKENGLKADLEGFQTAMQAQKDRARHAAVETSDWVVLKDATSDFVGYDYTTCDVEILKYRQLAQKGKTYYQLVLDKTPFYAEMGGQVGDSGYLEVDGQRLVVETVKKENNLSVHITASLPADPTQVFKAVVDLEKRKATSRNHTATHLLHEALREVLGSHVEQKGSLVSPDNLRFDFAHFQKVSYEELRLVEQKVNAAIRANLPLDEHRHTTIAEAKAMGAMALFGEKYGEEVRVIRFGSSAELCGGTHVQATGEIGAFRIVAESSIAAGIRRIEAITGEGADNQYFSMQDELKNIRALFNNSPQLTAAIEKLVSEHQEAQKKLEALMAEKTISLKQSLLQNAKTVNGIKLVVFEGEATADAIKQIAFQLRGEQPQGLAFIAGSMENGKPLLTVAFSDDLVAKGLNAGQLVREAAKAIQGGGGGQPHFATAGGKHLSGLKDAVNQLVASIG